MVRKEEVRAYKAKGHTAKETAEHFGISECYARQICSGIAPQSHTKGRPRNQDEIKSFIEKRLPDFEYFGNYTGADGKADIRCRTCGTVSTRSMITIRHRNVRCRECEAQRSSEIKKEQEAKAEERKHKTELNKARRVKQLRMAVCDICGEAFFTWNSRQKYCSASCRKESTRRYLAYNQGSDDRLNKSNIVDRDIDLKKLFKRDMGICQICGEPCDYSDCYTNENGTFIAGNTYPSKDHIIPLSEGGKHSWDNVRLAHRSCNSSFYWKNQRFYPSLGAKVPQIL